MKLVKNDAIAAHGNGSKIRLSLHVMQGEALVIFWFQVSSPEDPVS